MTDRRQPGIKAKTCCRETELQMSSRIEKIEKINVPAMALRGLVVFPGIAASFEVAREISLDSCEKALDADGMIFLAAQKDIDGDVVKENIFKVGTVAKIVQFVRLPDGNARIFIEPYCRANMVNAYISEKSFTADVITKTVEVDDNGGYTGEALIRECISSIEKLSSLTPRLSAELLTALKGIKNPGALADFVAANIFVSIEDKQKILEQYDPLKRLALLSVLLQKESEILKAEAEIHKKVRENLDENQREYYLKEQLKVIQGELGFDDADTECGEYLEKIYGAKLPKEVEEKLVKEVKKLEKNPYNSAEAAVIRNYIEVCLELPWTKRSNDRLDIALAQKILDADHCGLEKVKERIIEFLAVKQLNPEIKNQMICLVGPPGTGKTSVAASIAKAMNREYVRVSLGGVRDEADIRGHRKTYVASMPGRIINAIKNAGVRNPLILLDEIDKLTRDAHGDPSSALLEVLDGEQNKNFRDHFIELPFDLSECMFIATANTLDTVPRPLIDRMEIIELKIYTRHEKFDIARRHLIPKQAKRHGLNQKMIRFTDDAIFEIIDCYTKEAGVRNLEREIGSVCRKAAKIFVESDKKSLRISAKNVNDYLGERKILPETVEDKDEIGVVNGLAYTELGGDLLKVEAATMPGTGKLELTGSLGDVMKESAKAAISYIRANAVKYDIDPDFYKNKDIHIHVPEGAVPKDGPSAGVTITTALVSALTEKPVKHNVAMTGEVTLRGRVLPIGGLKEKTMAAYQNKVSTVFIPKLNEKDLKEIDPLARDGLDFKLCENVDEVVMNSIMWNRP